MPLEVSQENISFCQEVSILRGNNNIPLVAEDLIGRRTETVLTVICDREGPQLALEDIDYKDSSQGRAITIKGFVDDEHSIHKVSFNGIDIPVPKEQETSFSFSQALLLGREEDSIAFLTEDVAGNRNEGIIQLEFQRASERVIQPYASMQGLTRLAYLSGRNDSALDAGPLMPARTTRPFGDAVNEDGLASIFLRRT